MSHPRTEGAFDIDILFDGEVVARVLLDGVQDAFPRSEGTLIAGPAAPRWRAFIDIFIKNASSSSASIVRTTPTNSHWIVPSWRATSRR